MNIQAARPTANYYSARASKNAFYLVCALVIMFCLSGCVSISKNAHQVSSKPISSITKNQEQLSKNIAQSDEEIIFITPNKNLPVTNGPPQADNQKPIIVDKAPPRQRYESGKILIIRVEITGTTYAVEIVDDAAKKQILGYVDGMKTSKYNVMNTPPGGGRIIEVEVHRNNEIEEYSFSSQIIEGNALGRNFHNFDPTIWTIVDKDAFPTLSNYLPNEWTDETLAVLACKGGAEIDTTKTVNWNATGKHALTKAQLAKLRKKYNMENLSGQSFYNLMADLSNLNAIHAEDIHGMFLKQAPPNGLYPAGSSYRGSSFCKGNIFDAIKNELTSISQMKTFMLSKNFWQMNPTINKDEHLDYIKYLDSRTSNMKKLENIFSRIRG